MHCLPTHMHNANITIKFAILALSCVIPNNVSGFVFINNRSLNTADATLQRRQQAFYRDSIWLSSSSMCLDLDDPFLISTGATLQNSL